MSLDPNHMEESESDRDRARPPRDRALIATLTYSFARIGAALKMKVEDLRPKGAGWELRLHEKGGKHHVMPCHHALAEALRNSSTPPASKTTAKGKIVNVSCSISDC